MSNPPRFDPDFVVVAEIANAHLRSMQAYLAAGRRCQHVVLDDLRELVVLAYREWAAHPHQMQKMRVWEDACCELQLRGEEPPLPPVTDIEKIQRVALEMLEKPGMEDALEARYLETLKALADPKNRN